jgi:N-acetylmuramoyl-L-alanine amidase
VQLKNGKMKKVAIVVGHTKLRPGAKGSDIPAEYVYNSKVAQYLCDICDIYYYGSYNLGYKAMVKANAKKMNKKNYDLVIELHYNFFKDNRVNGCEVLYYHKNKTGKKLAKCLSENISTPFYVRDRGPKPLTSGKERGYWAVYYPEATTLLVEPFFGSNTKDVDKFKCSEELYSKKIRSFLHIQKLI